MVAADRRRQNLGPYASAALPALWRALARKDWSHAEFARRAKLTSGGVSKLLYGDVDAGRKIATFCFIELGVRLVLWDKTCPPTWRPHAYEDLRRGKRARDAEYGATGTDGE